MNTYARMNTLSLSIIFLCCFLFREPRPISACDSTRLKITLAKCLFFFFFFYTLDIIILCASSRTILELLSYPDEESQTIKELVIPTNGAEEKRAIPES